jgi:hypothetical protein
MVRLNPAGAAAGPVRTTIMESCATNNAESVQLREIPQGNRRALEY